MGNSWPTGVVQEETATRDRDIARRWTDGKLPVVKDTTKLSQDSYGLDDDTLENPQMLYVSGLQSSFDTTTLEIVSEAGKSSTSAAQRAPQRISPLHRCVACGEETDFVNVVRAPCRHDYVVPA
ncbi:uncharacterized protein BHQ10_009136 [Talaromyces amestolkiae]|uniref:Uncharacterized protein n=1 Tax=Talaromyces amestolkiae TaxID=1196081 RepID=A0A364LBD6_TALAM|nr:uncharacterized protein BHQ10_009136 [Talaromyces amestolkiae]RAO73124.1 hypothetical protein BHQ10_009136 [Talaromyces amestolkiae]